MLGCSCDDRALSAAKGTAVLVSQRDDKESRRGGGSATAFPDWGYPRSRNTSMWSWRCCGSGHVQGMCQDMCKI